MRSFLLLFVLLVFGYGRFSQNYIINQNNNHEISSLNTAHEIYLMAHKAFVEARFDDAIEMYQKVDQYIDQHQDIGKYFDHKYRNFSMVEMVKKRVAFGTIEPRWKHRVLVVFVENVSAPYQGGRIETKMEKQYLESAILACNVSARYAEVLSKGALSFEFDTVTLKSTVTRIEDSGNDGLAPADRIIYSLNPYPTELIFSNINKFDSFLFVWNHKDDQGKTIYKGPHGWGGVNTLAIDPYIYEATKRGRLVISTGLINRPGTIFHELFHTLEKCYGIDPIHGFRDSIRTNFPAWKGEGEMDYYQFHFNQITKTGFDEFCLSVTHPFDNEANVVEIGEHIPLDNRMSARKLMAKLSGNDLFKNEKIFKQAIELNPYDANIRLKYTVQLHQAGRKPEAFEQIKVAHKYSPSNAEVCYWMGVESYHNKDMDGAIRYLQEAIKLDSKMSKAQKYLDFVQQKKLKN